MTPLTASQRLRRLERILAGSRIVPPAVAADERDPATRHLESVPLDRIRALAELLDPGDGSNDDIDAVTMRLLLNDYATAVAHLRAATREAGARLDAATGPVTEGRRFLWRDEKLREELRQTAEQAPESADDLPGE